MLTHRLLVPGVYLLGVLLLIVGVGFIANGVPIVRMEIGWTEVVGGAVAASAGCVVLAMGVLASQLDAIRQSLLAPALDVMASADTQEAQAVTEAEDAQGSLDLAEPLPVPAVHPLAPQRSLASASAETAVQPEPFLPAAMHRPGEAPERVPSEDATPVPAVPPLLDESAPALLHAEEEASHSPPVEPPDRVADPVADLPTALPPRAKTNFLSSFLARRGIDAPRRQEAPGLGVPNAPFGAAIPPPPLHPLRTPVDLSSGWEEEPPGEEEDHRPADVLEPVEEPEAEPHEPPAHPEPDAVPVSEEPAQVEPDPLQPVVVGRYNAGSASYVMYSNGMIEVETEQGTHQFGSMQELKSFIEKRDARVS